MGDPLKDTAGPALNPLIKVINLISVIAASMMVVPLAGGGFRDIGLTSVSITVGVVGLLIIFVALWFSKRAASFGRELEEEPAKSNPGDK